MIWERFWRGPLREEEHEPAASPAAVIEEEIGEEEEELDELTEMLAVHSIVSEERHDEIITGVDSCRENLATITTQLQTLGAENPSILLLLERVSAMEGKLEAITAQLQALAVSSNPQPSPSENPQPRPPESAAVLPAVEPEEAAPPAPSRKRKFRRI